MRYEILSPLSTRGGDIRPLTTDLEGQRPRWPAYQQKPERPPHRSRLTRMAAEAVGPPSGIPPGVFLDVQILRSRISTANPQTLLR